MQDLDDIWFADDASASAHIKTLQKWWENLCNIGPLYGYYPNARKTWLVVREDQLEEANATFAGTEVQVSTTGRRELGAPLGNRTSPNGTSVDSLGHGLRSGTGCVLLLVGSHMQHTVPSAKDCEQNGCIFVELSPVHHLYYSHWKTKYNANLFLRLPDSPHRMMRYETCLHSPQGMEDWPLLIQWQLLTWSLTYQQVSLHHWWR